MLALITHHGGRVGERHQLLWLFRVLLLLWLVVLLQLLGQRFAQIKLKMAVLRARVPIGPDHDGTGVSLEALIERLGRFHPLASRLLLGGAPAKSAEHSQ